MALKDSNLKNQLATQISDDSEVTRQSCNKFESELSLHKDPRSMIESMEDNFFKLYTDVRYHQERVKVKLNSIVQGNRA